MPRKQGMNQKEELLTGEERNNKTIQVLKVGNMIYEIDNIQRKCLILDTNKRIQRKVDSKLSTLSTGGSY